MMIVMHLLHSFALPALLCSHTCYIHLLLSFGTCNCTGWLLTITADSEQIVQSTAEQKVHTLFVYGFKWQRKSYFLI